MNTQYVPPTKGSDGFYCPACGAFAHQTWYKTGIANEATPISVGNHAPTRQRETHPISGLADTADFARYHGMNNLFVSECQKCQSLAIWIHDQLVWPTGSNLPPPNPDLPGNVQSDYREAGAVAQYSPRSAAALLRLAVERLCRELVPEGKNLNARIGLLVERGLDAKIQQALDIVRVVGNNAVHPGKMDISDDHQTVATLFNLVNDIAEAMITRKNRIEELYGTLPESAKLAIADRDGTEPP